MSEFLITTWTVARQVPLSMEFFWQKYWSFPGHVTVEAGRYEIYVSGLYLETQARLLCHSVIPNFSPSLFLMGIF